MDIEKINFLDIENFETIIEYNFSLIKLELVLKNNETKEIYLKTIKAGKIKETIFCFWSLLYEEYLKNNQKEFKSTLRKAIISQKVENKNQNSIKLILDKELDYYADINLVEIRKIKFESDKKVERWLEDLEINNDDILFIGIKRSWKIIKNPV